MSITKNFLDQTVTTGGSFTFRGAPGQEVVLFWNVTGPVTGSSPTLQFTLQEVDPADETTPNGQSATSTVINATGVGTLYLRLIDSPAVLVTWTVGGTTPSFGGTKATIVSKTIGNQIAISATAANLNATVTQGPGSGASGTYWYVRATDGTNTMPTADTAARSSFHRVTDGTNTATVKAASTAAVVSDTALVVAVSPNNSVAITASSLPLPTGAATETTLASRLAEATFTARINTLGQKTMANSTPVVLSSDQSAIPITDNGGSVTVDGTVTANQGTAAAATAPWAVRASDGSAFISVALDRTTAGAPFSVRLTDGSAFYNAPAAGQFPAALVGGRLDANIGAWLGSTAPTVGQKTMANSVPIVIASNQTAVPAVGNAASGASASGNPVLVAGVEGSTVRTIRCRSDGTQYVELSGSSVQAVLIDDHPAFTLTSGAITIGNNKSLIALMNGGSSTHILRIREIYIVNSQTGSVTGIVASLALRRITGLSGGTSLTPVANDTNDALDGQVTAATNGTVSGESAAFIQRWYISTDEWGTGPLDTESLQATFQSHFPAFSRRDTEMRPLTLRAGQGLTVKCESNSTNGSFDLIIVFTQEDP